MMVASWEANLSEALRAKLKEVGWFVLISLLRWLMDRLTRGNPGGETNGAEDKPVGRVPGS